jgi:type VI protein secretion system component VasA
MAEADAQQNASMHPDVARALQDSGLPSPKVERYEVARFVLAPAAATATTE